MTEGYWQIFVRRGEIQARTWSTPRAGRGDCQVLASLAKRKHRGCQLLLRHVLQHSHSRLPIRTLHTEYSCVCSRMGVISDREPTAVNRPILQPRGCWFCCLPCYRPKHFWCQEDAVVLIPDVGGTPTVQHSRTCTLLTVPATTRQTCSITNDWRIPIADV
jgi:hypothetical protein